MSSCSGAGREGNTGVGKHTLHGTLVIGLDYYIPLNAGKPTLDYSNALNRFRK